MAKDLHRMYNTGGNTSTIDKGGNSQQLSDFYFKKKALTEAAKDQYFQQLANTTAMPKHMGKRIKQYVYIPLLDDENINDQGINAQGAKITNGNLYGSSKDVGTIPDKLPVLSETGGRVNRVGFTRKIIEGTLQKYGFFSDYTQESIDFDSDAELMMHVNSETIKGANEITEDVLQMDLLNAAATIRYPSGATSLATVNKAVTYDDFVRLAIDLDNNRTPKHTTMITGTRMIDTKVLPSCRVMYVGSELIPLLKQLKDYFDNPAFIPVQHYAAGTTVLRGEVGSVDQFRIVVVPEMLHWAGAGSSGKDVFPMLVVGDGSFTTIGFQTGGKSFKFTQIHKRPGEATASEFDPYGEKGFMSIKWYYGFMALRPERIALMYTTEK